MKKIIAIALTLILTLGCLAACSASDRIQGTWTYTETGLLGVVTEHSYTFHEDGTGKMPGELGVLDLDMTYTVDGKTLTIHNDVYGDYVYTIAISGDTLTLTGTDGTVLTLTKAQ